jgi:hypothetical protein
MKRSFCGVERVSAILPQIRGDASGRDRRWTDAGRPPHPVRGRPASAHPTETNIRFRIQDYIFCRKKLAGGLSIWCNTTFESVLLVRSTIQGGTSMSRVVTPPLAQPTSNSPMKIPHDKIAMRAYEKWVKRGRPQGTDLQDWVEAENELKAEMIRTSSKR